MKPTGNTLDNIIVARPAPREILPQGLCLDRGHDYDEVRDIVQKFGFTAHIRARGEEARAIKHAPEFKAMVVSLCRPGVSTSAVALAHGLTPIC